jgi:tetratricopeptide (TPR) repeat protein
VDVCRAVQHAHQKGVIHRDLKPGNVLVALYDDRPVPKVIDFGVAKATGQQLTEQTLNTEFGAVVGTLEYMSPEQASFNQLDVDTRSDVYSLGVLLYELLAGSPPFSRKELERAGVLEMLRLIREQEPAKPSMKLSTADGLPTLAANRGTEPRRLTALVRGELDWIVMRALEKDRNRRYDSANGLAQDVERYLADEPVAAGPPTAAYRLRKFARRHWRPLAVASGFVGLLCAAVVVLVYAVVVIDKERTQKDLALTAEKSAKARTREALDEMFSQVIEDWLVRKGDPTPEQRQFLNKALDSYEAFAAEEGADVETRAGVAEARLRTGLIQARLGHDPEALRAFEQAEADFRALSAADDQTVTKYRRGLAVALRDRATELSVLGKPEEADAPHTEAVELFGRLADERSREPGPQTDLAVAVIRQVIHLRNTRRPMEALRVIDRVLPLPQQFADQSPYSVNHQLAVAFLWRARATLLNDLSPVLQRPGIEAEKMADLRRSLEMYERLARRSPPIPEAQHHAGRIRVDLGIERRNQFDDEKALVEFHRAEEWFVQLVAAYPRASEYREAQGHMYLELCRSLVRLGQAAAAVETAEKAHRIWQALADQSPNPEYKLGLASAEGRIGDACLLVGEVEEAVRHYGRAIDGAQNYLIRPGPRMFVYADLAQAHAGRAAAHDRADRFDEALSDWDEAIKYGGKEGGNVRYRVGKAVTQTRAGQPAEGEKILVQLHRNLQKVEGEACFQAACAAAVLAGAKPYDADRARRAEGMGLDFLKRDDENGLFQMLQWADRLRSEPSLEPLRRNPAIKEMMGRAPKPQK